MRAEPPGPLHRIDPRRRSEPWRVALLAVKNETRAVRPGGPGPIPARAERKYASIELDGRGRLAWRPRSFLFVQVGQAIIAQLCHSRSRWDPRAFAIPRRDV